MNRLQIFKLDDITIIFNKMKKFVELLIIILYCLLRKFSYFTVKQKLMN